MAHGLKTNPGRRLLCGGAASRRGDRDYMAGGVRGDAEHTEGHENESVLHLPTGYAAAWDRPRYFARSSCCRREWKQLFFYFSSSRPRLFESGQQRGATWRSTVGISAHGGVFERELAGRGRGILLGKTEGIRLSPVGCSKSVLSERHRVVARAARIRHLAAAPSRLRQRNDLYIGPSQ